MLALRKDHDPRCACTAQVAGTSRGRCEAGWQYQASRVAVERL